MWGLLESPWLTWGLAAVSAVVTYLFWAQTYWTRRGVPQTRPIPLVGDLWESLLMRRTPGEILHELHRKFDPYPFFGFYKTLGKPVLLIRDPDLVKEVLVQNFVSFQHNEVVFPEGKDPVFSENPFSASFDRWKGLRMRMTQLLNPARVRLAFADIAESSRVLVKYVEACGENTSIDGNLLCKRFTCHTTARVLFGIESHSLEPGSAPGPFFDMGNCIFNGDAMTMLRFIAFIHCPSLLYILGHRFVPSKTINFFSKLIEDSVAYRQKEGITRDDFIQYASKNILVDGKIDKTLIPTMTSQAINSYIEMFDTSSVAMGSTLLMLATHQDQQAKLRAELQNAPENALEQADFFNSLPLLDWIIKETMRLFPVADMLRRSSTKTTVLRSGGHSLTIKPGETVYVAVDALHRDPTLYSEPDRFIPERFAPGQVESRHKMAYLPFGEGPRMCPGYRYALQQIKVGVAALLLRFEVHPAPEQLLPLQRDPTALLLGFKGGMWLRFRKVDVPSAT